MTLCNEAGSFPRGRGLPDFTLPGPKAATFYPLRFSRGLGQVGVQEVLDKGRGVALLSLQDAPEEAALVLQVPLLLLIRVILCSSSNRTGFFTAAAPSPGK